MSSSVSGCMERASSGVLIEETTGSSLYALHCIASQIIDYAPRL